MMTPDQILDVFQREVELEGKSHANCVFQNDLTLEIPREGYRTPQFSTTDEELFEADFTGVLESLNFPERWKDLVVQNEMDIANPPRVLCVQFLEQDHRVMSMTVTLMHCDMYGELPNDVRSANSMLFRFCEESGFEPGNIIFNINVAYTLYSDMEFIEENTIDWGD